MTCAKTCQYHRRVWYDITMVILTMQLPRLTCTLARMKSPLLQTRETQHHAVALVAADQRQ
jgi:hypothetical protein